MIQIYLYVINTYEAKYQFLINKKKSTGINYFNDSKAFLEYSNNMQNVYKNIEAYNPNKKRKILIVFDDMVADMLSNKNLNSIVTEIFVRSRKLNIPLVFITLSYSKVPKKIPNKRIIHQILNLKTL